MPKDPAPVHPFEVRITIGGEDWSYVRYAATRIAEYIAEHEPGNYQWPSGLSSGGGGGCHSIDVRRRDVSVEQFHKELEEWRVRQVAEREGNAHA